MRLTTTSTSQRLLPVTILLLCPLGLTAVVVDTAFLSARTGWSVNRYAPNSFTNTGTYQRKPNVIALEISNSDGRLSRAYPFDIAFYSTQGMQFDLSGGPGTEIDMTLYIPSDWANAASTGRSRTQIPSRRHSRAGAR